MVQQRDKAPPRQTFRDWLLGRNIFFGRRKNLAADYECVARLSIGPTELSHRDRNAGAVAERRM
jgi:hypothetical protein